MSDVQADIQNAPVTEPAVGLENAEHTPATLPPTAPAVGSIDAAFIRDELDAIKFAFVSGTGTALDRLGMLSRYIEARM